MRILRGLSSRVLACGCLTGVYETYDNEIVGVLDARGPTCADVSHEPGHTVPHEDLHRNGLTERSESSSRDTPSA